MASLSLYPQFETNLISNGKVIGFSFFPVSVGGLGMEGFGVQWLLAFSLDRGRARAGVCQCASPLKFKFLCCIIVSRFKNIIFFCINLLVASFNKQQGPS